MFKKKKKRSKFFLKFIFVSVIIGITVFYGFRAYISFSANSIIDKIIEDAQSAYPDDEDNQIIFITAEFHQRFREENASLYPLHRLEPYLSNARLPSFIKFRNGTIDTFMMVGQCDSAARGLILALKRFNLDAVQWDMITNKYAHSAVMVTTSTGQEVLLDPFNGIIGQNRFTGALQSPQQIKDALLRHEGILNLLHRTSPSSDYQFYKYLDTARMNAFGQSLLLDSTIPTFTGSTLTLGELDGRSDDVKAQSLSNEMTPFWYYLGHRFDRSWVRMLTTDRDINVTFVLTAPPEDGVITSDMMPTINGNKVTWSLNAGESLTLYDGRARINWRRLNSYIDVDQIIFTLR